MLDAISKILKISELNLIIYSLIVSTGSLFFMYFMFYLFLTGNPLFLIIGLVEGAIAILTGWLLYAATKK